MKTNKLCLTPYIVTNSLPVPLEAAQCALVNSMMYKVPVPRIKHAHVSRSIKRSWRQLLFLHVTITSSFCGLRSFHQMLNKFKYCTQYCVMAAGSSWLHTNVRTHSLTFLCQMSLLWRSQSSLLYYWKRYKKGVDYKRRNSFSHSPPKRL